MRTDIHGNPQFHTIRLIACELKTGQVLRRRSAILENLVIQVHTAEHLVGQLIQGVSSRFEEYARCFGHNIRDSLDAVVLRVIVHANVIHIVLQQIIISNGFGQLTTRQVGLRLRRTTLRSIDGSVLIGENDIGMQTYVRGHAEGLGVSKITLLYQFRRSALVDLIQRDILRILISLNTCIGRTN